MYYRLCYFPPFVILAFSVSYRNISYARPDIQGCGQSTKKLMVLIVETHWLRRMLIIRVEFRPKFVYPQSIWKKNEYI